MDEALTMRRRFVELAPWAANGTASAADRAWVERYARSHLEARQELEWYASLRQCIRDDAPERSPEAGLERLLHRVRVERQPVPREPQGGLALLLGRVRHFFSQVAIRPVVAYGALALVVVVLLDQQGREPEYAEFRSLASVQASGPVLRVTFKAEAEGALEDYLGFSDEPLVSTDYQGTEYSAVVDGLSTMVSGPRMGKVVAWYDNEWGYSCRIADLAALMAAQGF